MKGEKNPILFFTSLVLTYSPYKFKLLNIWLEDISVPSGNLSVTPSLLTTVPLIFTLGMHRPATISTQVYQNKWKENGIWIQNIIYVAATPFGSRINYLYTINTEDKNILIDILANK